MKAICLKVNVENSLSIRYQAELLDQLKEGFYRLKVDKGDFDALMAKGRGCTLEFEDSRIKTAVIQDVLEENDVFLVTVKRNGK